MLNSPTILFARIGFDIQNARFEEKALKERLTGLQNDQKLIADGHAKDHAARTHCLGTREVASSMMKEREGK
jgi:hypothetical protein